MSVASPPKYPCSDCGTIASRSKRTPEGGICRSCYNIRRREPCSNCGKHTTPSTRTAAGDPLCGHCARPKRSCTGCGQIDHIKTSGEDGELCQRCYTAPARRCGRCNDHAPIAIKARPGAVDLCRRCATAPEETCGSCGLRREVHTRWPLGPVCVRCYRRTLSESASCADCGTTAALIGRNAASQRTCGPCAGSDLDYRCSTCGGTGQHHFARTCHRCSIIRLARELLSTPQGSVPDSLQELPAFLAARGQPRSTLRWLSKPATAQLLSALASSEHPMSHTVLDQCPPGWGRHHLRELLIDAAILPERDEALERLDTWINDTAAALPTHHSALIRPYGHWAILRRARRRSRRRRFTHAAADSGRTKIRIAITLLTHLDQHGHTVGDLTQPMLDAWTDGQHHRTNNIAGFITWLTQRGLAANISVTRYPVPPPSQTGDEHTQQRAIAALLSDDTSADLPTRIAGLLVLLYGARLPQVQNLTTSSLTRDRGRRYVTLAHHPIELPERLAELIDTLAGTVCADPRARARDGRGYYLFRGGIAHHPLHVRTLSRKLTTAGIPTRISRNHALLALGADLPAAVLATQLGLSSTTSSQWAQLAQRDYTAYLHSHDSHDTEHLTRRPRSR